MLPFVFMCYEYGLYHEVETTYLNNALSSALPVAFGFSFEIKRWSPPKRPHSRLSLPEGFSLRFRMET